MVIEIVTPDGRKKIDVDTCIVPLVKALNDGGITTVASCCGHGKTTGTIALTDGRQLDIFSDFGSWFKHAQTHGHCKKNETI